MLQGIFSVYKPVGITSHDVVNKIRAATGVKRVGHGGTLDPLAEGVLVIAVGRENTKLLDTYVKGDKEYIATLMLGYISETDDKEGPIYEYSHLSPKKLPTNEVQPQLGSKKNIIDDNIIGNIPTKSEIRECIKKFIGEIMQTPPIYSAVKINGREAYKYARAARHIAHANTQIEPLHPNIKARKVFIKDIQIIRYNYPILEIKVECKKGVYIRSLARDIGEMLQTGAYLTKLVRTKVGKFKLADTLDVNNLDK
jgi:tRNA pseudouridine55 synthase